MAERLRHLKLAYPEIEQRVVAPIPWFPFRHPVFGNYARMASVPSHEDRCGVDILHPRYPVIPRIGMNLAPLLMAARCLPYVKRIHHEFPFDLIDAHFLYPDGIAAVMIGRALGVPVVVTARGSDVTLYSQWRLTRIWLSWSLRRASAVCAVCQALADAIAQIEPEIAVRVLRNGVDLDKFKPLPREDCRKALELDRFTLLSVGNLIELKGHHLVIEALRDLPDVTLLIAGEGAWREHLQQLANDLGVGAQVRFLGLVPHDELAQYYSAADALMLASSREGWANVLLESMACGTPVVATAVWGTPEVVRAPEAGVLIDERSAVGIRDGIRKLQNVYPDRSATRRYAEQFSWVETSCAQRKLFLDVIEHHMVTI